MYEQKHNLDRHQAALEELSRQALKKPELSADVLTDAVVHAEMDHGDGKRDEDHCIAIDSVGLVEQLQKELQEERQKRIRL